MKRKSLGIACCMLVAMVLFNSCSKEGPAGATGPAGPAGPAGAGGAAGTPGTPGAPGVANIIYSEWLDVLFVVDTVHNANGKIDTINLGFKANISAPKLTNDILTKGEIKVYWNRGSAATPVIFPVPYFDAYTIMNPFFYLSNIRLLATDDLGTGLNSSNVKVWQYRYILIPGSVPARSIINWDNYQEVKKYLNLKD